jgi:REP-associated tyrosine transposase
MRENYILFFTATIKDWRNLLSKEKYKEVIIDSLKFLVEQKRVFVYSFVIMPNHIHILWKIRDSHKLQDVKRDFLKFTAQTIKYDLEKNHPKVLPYFISKRKDRKYQFWQDRSYNNRLSSRKIVEQKIDYIHNNPLTKKWKLTDKPENYKFSSAKFYIENIKNWEFITHYVEHI